MCSLLWRTLHIAFNAHSLGHYDAAFWASPEPQQLTEESTSPQQPTCSCGRKSTKGMPCSLQLNVYTTRCLCYNLQSGCNHKCRYKNCQNPYGKRLAPAEKSAAGTKRKVEPHTYQKQSLKGINMKFMDQVNEPVKTGAFSIIETLLISAIIQNLDNPDRQVTIDEIDTLKIHSAYTSIRKVAEAFNLQLPVHDRSLTEVQRMCESYCQRYQLFDRLHM